MNRKYWKKRRENPLPKLQEDERIYLNVPYNRRYFAKDCRCGFDPERKLWFTGCYNAWLDELIECYGINDQTSEKARELIKQVQTKAKA